MTKARQDEVLREATEIAKTLVVPPKKYVVRKQSLKTYAVYIKSESGDGWLFAFKAEQMPMEDAEWLPILEKHLPGHTKCREYGVGIADTGLYVEDCIEVT